MPTEADGLSDEQIAKLQARIAALVDREFEKLFGPMPTPEAVLASANRKTYLPDMKRKRCNCPAFICGCYIT